MPAWVRKFVVAVAIVVIAAAGVTAPGLAHATGHPTQTAALTKHAGHVQATGAATTPCDKHGPLHGKGKPDHPCCAAACATTLAFIVATVDLSYPPSDTERSIPVTQTFPAAPIGSIERPPRTI